MDRPAQAEAGFERGAMVSYHLSCPGRCGFVGIPNPCVYRCPGSPRHWSSASRSCCSTVVRRFALVVATGIVAGEPRPAPAASAWMDLSSRLKDRQQTPPPAKRRRVTVFKTAPNLRTRARPRWPCSRSAVFRRVRTPTRSFSRRLPRRPFSRPRGSFAPPAALPRPSRTSSRRR